MKASMQKVSGQISTGLKVYGSIQAQAAKVLQQ
jgi:hypothetical protein